MEWNKLCGTVKYLWEEGHKRAITDDDRDHNWYFRIALKRAMAQDAGITGGGTRELDKYGCGKINFGSPTPPENFICGNRTNEALDKWTEWVHSLPQKQNSLPQKPKLGWLSKIRLVFTARG